MRKICEQIKSEMCNFIPKKRKEIEIAHQNRFYIEYKVDTGYVYLRKCKLEISSCRHFRSVFQQLIILLISIVRKKNEFFRE